MIYINNQHIKEADKHFVMVKDYWTKAYHFEIGNKSFWHVDAFFNYLRHLGYDIPSDYKPENIEFK